MKIEKTFHSDIREKTPRDSIWFTLFAEEMRIPEFSNNFPEEIELNFSTEDISILSKEEVDRLERLGHIKEA